MGEELTLYLSVSPTIMKAILIKEEDKIQRPVYYVSKVFLGVENRYLKIEKLTYALIISVKKIHHYFPTHPIIVLTDQPLKQIP